MWYRPIPCPNKAEPGAGHNVDREPSKSTDGNESRHDWSKGAEHAISKGDGNGIAGKHGGGAKDGKVGHVGGHVDEGDQRERYVNGPEKYGSIKNGKIISPWQIDIGFSQFFSHEVQVVPSRIAKYSRIEGNCNLTGVGCCALLWNSGSEQH